MEATTAVLIGSGFATLGWLYTARRARVLAKKQHTINVMLQTSLNDRFLEAKTKIAPSLRQLTCPEDVINRKDEELRSHFRLILNHYEFIAAGLRNGDLHERLVRDSERSTIVMLFKSCKKYIWACRDDRSRMSMYEHLEWLYIRWEERPPNLVRRVLEAVALRPFPGRRARRR
jgi:hypothetical protein